MSVKKNYIYNVIYQITNILLPLITAPYISRVIGAEGIGVVSYTHSIALYFGMFGLLGLNNYGNRTIASIRENKTRISREFWSIYFLQIITTSIMTIGYLIFVYSCIKSNKIIAYIQIIYLLSTMLDINWFFFGLEQFKITVTRSIIIKLISFCMIFIFVRNREATWIYALILVLSMFLSQIVLWPFLKNKVYFIKPTFNEIKKHIKPNVVLFIPVITISMYKVMDKIMLGSLSDMLQAGLYENSLKIINVPMGIITALGTVMLPKMSNMFANGEIKKSKQYIRKSMKFAMFLAYAMFFGLLGISDVLAPVFFGNEFNEAGVLIGYLSVTIVLISWANVIRAQYLIPNKKERVYITSVILGAITNIAINFILIPNYGAIGAVMGTIAAELIVTVSQSIMVRKELPISYYFMDSLPFAFSGLLMCLIVKMVEFKFGITLITLIIQIISGAFIYLALSILIISKVDKSEFKAFMNMVRKTNLIK